MNTIQFGHLTLKNAKKHDITPEMIREHLKETEYYDDFFKVVYDQKFKNDIFIGVKNGRDDLENHVGMAQTIFQKFEKLLKISAFRIYLRGNKNFHRNELVDEYGGTKYYRL